MLKSIVTTLRNKQSSRSPGMVTGHPDAASTPNAAKSDIDGLYILSRRGLWGLLIFLAASVVALYFRDQTLSASLASGLREQFGPTPPVFLINIVLVVSTICSLITIFGRLYNGRKPGSTLSHLWFRIFFFFLYFIADSLSGHFNTVFISGLAVLALQHYHICQYTSRAIDMKSNVWGRVST